MVSVPTWTDIVQATSATLTLFAALYVGIKQNEINKKALGISDYVGIILSANIKTINRIAPSPGQLGQMPAGAGQNNVQVLETIQMQEGFSIRNASAYPIYLESYTIGTSTEQLGNAMLPHGLNAQHQINIPREKLTDTFKVTINFEDYLYKKYKTEHEIKLVNNLYIVRGSSRAMPR